MRSVVSMLVRSLSIFMLSKQRVASFSATVALSRCYPSFVLVGAMRNVSERRSVF